MWFRVDCEMGVKIIKVVFWMLKWGDFSITNVNALSGVIIIFFFFWERKRHISGVLYTLIRAFTFGVLKKFAFSTLKN